MKKSKNLLSRRVKGTLEETWVEYIENLKLYQ